MKQCSKCHEFKTENNFNLNPKYVDGFQSYCKGCLLEYKNKRNKIRIKHHDDMVVGLFLSCPVLIKQYNDLQTQKKSNIIKKLRQWQRDNPDKIRSRRVQPLNKLKSDLGNKIRAYIRQIQKFLAGKRVRPLSDCHVAFKIRFESLFRDGMNWDNHRILWVVDHIKSLSQFGNSLFNIKVQREANSIDNLQPLLIHENYEKSKW